MTDQGSAQDFIRISQYHLALIAGGFAITGGLVGAWLNHYFSGSRDIRKEFNDAARVINEKLIAERSNPSPFEEGPTETEFEIFAQHLSSKDRRNFVKVIERYKKEKNEQNVYSPEGGIGVLYYENPSRIVNEINKIFKFTKRK